MTLASILVRSAEYPDAAALESIHSAAWRSTYRGLLHGIDLEQMISRRHVSWWRGALSRRVPMLVIDFDDETAGYVSFGSCRNIDWKCEGEIYELYLRPEYQGVGLGRQLFEAARNALATFGYHSLAVRVLTANNSACSFYEHMGGRKRWLDWHHDHLGTSVELSVFVWPDAQED